MLLAKEMAQADDEAHAKATMLRTKSFKYVSRITGEDELYDLKNDPQEKINQINNIEYKEILLQLKDKLLRWMQETSDIVPFDYDSRMNETMLWNLVKGWCQQIRKMMFEERLEVESVSEHYLDIVSR